MSAISPIHTPHTIVGACTVFSAHLIGYTSITAKMSAQYYFRELLYTLTNCIFCFPSSPQLKINSRSFKMLRLLGEVRCCQRIFLICALISASGWLLVRLSGPGNLHISTLCIEEDPLPVWTRICLACAKRGGGLYFVQSTSKHHRVRRLFGIVGERQIGSRQQNSLHNIAILSKR